MLIKITYFVHSTTGDNENHISSGWNDVGLSELGIEQSHELLHTLKDKKFDTVICSDLLRARQTADIVFPHHPSIIYDKRLRECNYGDLNGKATSIVEPLQEKNINTPFSNGESYEDVHNRIQSLLREVQEKFNGTSIAFVSSKAPQIVLDVLLRGMTWEEAFASDWRKTKKWQAGWEYILNF